MCFVLLHYNTKKPEVFLYDLGDHGIKGQVVLHGRPLYLHRTWMLQVWGKLILYHRQSLKECLIEMIQSVQICQ